MDLNVSVPRKEEEKGFEFGGSKDQNRKGWKCMDPKTNKFVTYRDVVFDEVPSWYPPPTHTSTVTNALNDAQENLEIFPETSAQRSDVSPVARMDSPSSDDGEQHIRRSSREKRKPGYLKDHEVQLNNCTVTSCFFVGELNEEEPMKRWKAWEEETTTLEYQITNDPRRFRLTGQTSFGRRHLKCWSNRPLLLWPACFLRQFRGSVTKIHYFTLRNGFIMAHMAEGSNFNFRKFLSRAFDEDFEVVMGSGIRQAVFTEHVTKGLKHWHGMACRNLSRNKSSSRGPSSGPVSIDTTETSPDLQLHLAGNNHSPSMIKCAPLPSEITKDEVHPKTINYRNYDGEISFRDFLERTRKWERNHRDYTSSGQNELRDFRSN
ncbi:hypothetical protein MRB53_019424 [Persea americana]|uniref:Uncharacterized protein n=1 Tax=Persea americana TaxID=3435 RepID=A0ACC2KZ52_PERAE|nr:hypothetical protein MRB53_019424 [Persea americana]